MKYYKILYRNKENFSTLQSVLDEQIENHSHSRCLSKTSQIKIYRVKVAPVLYSFAFSSFVGNWNFIVNDGVRITSKMNLVFQRQRRFFINWYILVYVLGKYKCALQF